MKFLFRNSGLSTGNRGSRRLTRGARGKGPSAPSPKPLPHERALRHVLDALSQRFALSAGPAVPTGFASQNIGLGLESGTEAKLLASSPAKKKLPKRELLFLPVTGLEPAPYC